MQERIVLAIKQDDFRKADDIWIKIDEVFSGLDSIEELDNLLARLIEDAHIEDEEVVMDERYQDACLVLEPKLNGLFTLLRFVIPDKNVFYEAMEGDVRRHGNGGVIWSNWVDIYGSTGDELGIGYRLTITGREEGGGIVFDRGVYQGIPESMFESEGMADLATFEWNGEIPLVADLPHPADLGTKKVKDKAKEWEKRWTRRSSLNKTAREYPASYFKDAIRNVAVPATKEYAEVHGLTAIPNIFLTSEGMIARLREFAEESGGYVPDDHYDWAASVLERQGVEIPEDIRRKTPLAKQKGRDWEKRWMRRAQEILPDEFDELMMHIESRFGIYAKQKCHANALMDAALEWLDYHDINVTEDSDLYAVASDYYDGALASVSGNLDIMDALDQSVCASIAEPTPFSTENILVFLSVMAIVVKHDDQDNHYYIEHGAEYLSSPGKTPISEEERALDWEKRWQRRGGLNDKTYWVIYEVDDDGYQKEGGGLGSINEARRYSTKEEAIDYIWNIFMRDLDSYKEVLPELVPKDYEEKEEHLSWDGIEFEVVRNTDESKKWEQRWHRRSSLDKHAQEYPRGYGPMLGYIGAKYGYDIERACDNSAEMGFAVMWLDQEVESVDYMNSEVGRDLREDYKRIKAQINEIDGKGEEVMQALADAWAYSGQIDQWEIEELLGDVWGINLEHSEVEGDEGYIITEGREKIKAGGRIPVSDDYKAREWEKRWMRRGQVDINIGDIVEVIEDHWGDEFYVRNNGISGWHGRTLKKGTNGKVVDFQEWGGWKKDQVFFVNENGTKFAADADAVKVINKKPTPATDWEKRWQRRSSLNKQSEYEHLTIQTSDVPEEVVDQIRDIQSKIDLDKLYDGEDEQGWVENGIQKKLHITILFGVKAKDEKDISDTIKKYRDKNGKDITAETAGIDYFDNEEDKTSVAVLRIDTSGGLGELHKELREKFDNEQRPGEYKAHVTIAYLKLGERLDDAEVKPIEFNIGDIEMSKKDGSVVKVGGLTKLATWSVWDNQTQQYLHTGRNSLTKEEAVEDCFQFIVSDPETEMTDEEADAMTTEEKERYCREFGFEFHEEELRRLTVPENRQHAQEQPLPEGVSPLIDFRYIAWDHEYPHDTEEYKLLSALEDNEWIEYLDSMARTGVIVEYNSVEDSFEVRTPTGTPQSQKEEQMPDKAREWEKRWTRRSSLDKTAYSVGDTITVPAGEYEYADEAGLTLTTSCDTEGTIIASGYIGGGAAPLEEVYRVRILSALFYEEEIMVRADDVRGGEPSEEGRKWEQRWQRRGSLNKQARLMDDIWKHGEHLDSWMIDWNPVTGEAEANSGEEHHIKYQEKYYFVDTAPSDNSPMNFYEVVETEDGWIPVADLEMDEQRRRGFAPEDDKNKMWEKRWMRRSV